MPQPDPLTSHADPSSLGLDPCLLRLLTYYLGQSGISFTRSTDLHLRRLGGRVRIYGIAHQIHSNRRPFPGPIPRRVPVTLLGKAITKILREIL